MIIFYFSERTLPTLLLFGLISMTRSLTANVNPALQAACDWSGPGAPAKRPFRAPLIRFAPKYDRIKPPGLADYSGVTEASGMLIGAYDEHWIAAVRIRSMAPAWWIKAPADLTVPPAVFGNWGVLGFRNGRLTKFNVTSGRIEWETDLESFAARPIQKMGHRLIVVTASQAVYAIDYETGKPAWAYHGQDPDQVAIRTMSPPLIHEGVVYVGLASGEVAALSGKNGKKRWIHNPGFSDQRFQDVTGSMLIVGRTLILSRYDGMVAGINIDKPSLPAASLKEPVRFTSITANAFRHGRMYIGTHNGSIHALNPSTGHIIWQAQPGTSISSIHAGESKIYVTGARGRLTALDSRSGRLLWHDQPGGAEGSLLAPPVYMDKKIYFPTALKMLYGYHTN